MNIYEKLSNIQAELKAPKDKYNNFGKYSYRSAESILEAVKPLCKKYKSTLVLSDEIMNIGERYYVKARAELFDLEKEGSAVDVIAYAREDAEKKGMDGSQITGSCSSYARKYALNGLFNIDDTKDADTDEFHNQTTPTPAPKVEDKVIGKKEVQTLTDLIKNAPGNSSFEDRVKACLAKVGATSIETLKTSQYNYLLKMLMGNKK